MPQSAYNGTTPIRPFTARPDWFDDAACTGLGPAIFFPAEPKGRPTSRPVVRAVAICNRCPVRTECTEYGRNERFGIWGGLPPRTRHGRSVA